MTGKEKLLYICMTLMILAPFVALAIWLDWSLGTTLSIMAIVFILGFDLEDIEAVETEEDDDE